jgi:density-regulated protein
LYIVLVSIFGPCNYLKRANILTNPNFFIPAFLLLHTLLACTLPPEYCEYGPKEKYTNGCLPFIEKNFPHLLKAAAPAAAPSSTIGDGSGKPIDAETATLSSGVAALSVSASGDSAPKKAAKKAAEPKAPLIMIEVKERGRRTVTTICGLEAYGIKLKEAASALGKKFGAGASVGKSATGVQEIDVQGDVAFDLPELINKLYPNVSEDCIRVKGD